MRGLAIALAALSMAAILPIGARAAPTSYPVICRVGAAMYATLNPGGSVRVHFTRGTTAATPSPGQCVWIDRGFGASEPNVLFVSGNPTMARYFVDAIFNGGTFYAHVYNNGHGVMIVTRIGP